MVQEVLYSSKNENWMTDPKFLAYVYELGAIALDPCFHPKSHVIAANTFTYPEKNGLEEPWHVYGGLCFCNPPYGRQIIKWVLKAILEASKGTEIVMLIPARVDTKAFQDFIFKKCQAICFVKGRLTFYDADKPEDKKDEASPFPSSVIYFGPNKKRFKEVFKKIGKTFDCEED